MRYICFLSILIMANGCAATRIKSVTGPTGNPSYSITCHQERGLCYKAAYDTCKGGYYILDAAAVTSAGTGRHVTKSQDRPGRASQEHNLLVQCTGSGYLPSAQFAGIHGPTDDTLLRTTTAPRYGATALPPAKKQVQSRYRLSRDPYLTPYADPYRRYYTGRDAGRDSRQDPYGEARTGTYVPAYSEYAVPPYPGYRGSRYGRRYRRRKRPRKRKAVKKAKAPKAADCACP